MGWRMVKLCSCRPMILRTERRGSAWICEQCWMESVVRDTGMWVRWEERNVSVIPPARWRARSLGGQVNVFSGFPVGDVEVELRCDFERWGGEGRIEHRGKNRISRLCKEE